MDLHLKRDPKPTKDHSVSDTSPPRFDHAAERYPNPPSSLLTQYQPSSFPSSHSTLQTHLHDKTKTQASHLLHVVHKRILLAAPLGLPIHIPSETDLPCLSVEL